MPFEAAKAIAATFCWEIRYLLTPLFGLDFPEICIPPTDRARFGRMVIDPTIVNEAAETARRYRLLEPRNYDEMATTSFPSHALRAPYIPHKYSRRDYDDCVSSARGSSSEPYCGSPQSAAHGGFISVNRPPSSHPVTRTAYECFKGAGEHRKRTMKATGDGSDSETELSSTSRSEFPPKSTLPMRYTKEGVWPAEEDSEMDHSELTSSDDETMSEEEGDEEYREPRSRGPSGSAMTRGKTELKKNPSRATKAKIGEQGPRSDRFTKEVKAAHALLRLHMQRASSKDEDKDGIMVDAAFGPLLGPSRPGDKKRRRASL